MLDARWAGVLHEPRWCGPPVQEAYPYGMDARAFRAVPWPMLLIGAVLLVVLAVNAIAGLPLISPADAPTSASVVPQPGGSDATSSGQPTAEAAVPLELAEVPWVAAHPAMRPDGALAGWYALSAGTLADPEPLVDLQVELAPRLPGNLSLALQPTALPVGVDRLLYVSDDGATSTIQLGQIAAGAEFAEVARLPQVVWSAAIDESATGLYLLLLDRVTATDAGVWRLPLPGAVDAGGVPEMVLLPRGAAQSTTGTRLAAITEFSGGLRVDSDGEWLARLLCIGADCATDVLSLTDGEVASGLAIEPVGFAGDWLISRSLCLRAPCPPAPFQAENFETGARQELTEGRDGVAALELDGRPIVVRTVATDRTRSRVVETVDLESGETTQIAQAAPGDGFHIFQANAFSWVYRLPSGWLQIDLLKPEGVSPTLAIPLHGGQPIELPMPNVTEAPAGPPQG